MTVNPVARFRSPVEGKFGLPRQSGLAPGLRGEIVFEPQYRNPDAVRGLEGFDRIWLLWQFDRNPETDALTVRPPRLGGNEQVGVFASRSPFRPNGIGLSCVRLLGVDMETAEGPVLHVAGADLADGTPVLDIKPYLAYADAFPDARCGYAQKAPGAVLKVTVPPGISDLLGEDAAALEQILSLDPRPAWQDDPQRIYGFVFKGRDVHFRIEGDRLEVLDAELARK